MSPGLLLVTLKEMLEEAQFKQRRAELALTHMKRSMKKYSDAYMDKVTLTEELQDSTEKLLEKTALLDEAQMQMAIINSRLADTEQAHRKSKMDVTKLQASLRQTSRSLEYLRVEHSSTLTSCLTANKKTVF